MLCYQCGYDISTVKGVCPNCGAAVADYKKIVYLSNYFYNEGLEKAKVRNLQGAVSSLRQSLRFIKENIPARNLLGLIYYETGEIANALSEWVISVNIQPEDNLADAYIALLQSNQNRLDKMNQAARKYNQALDYCDQGSNDLAVIQLKSALSTNPRFLRARQLLSLLYLQAKDYTAAAKELKKLRSVDAANTTTMKYIKEVEEEGGEMALITLGGKKVGGEEAISYKNGNETIIQPTGGMAPSLDGTVIPGGLINLLIGMLVGAAIIGFLFMPGRIQSIRNDAQEQLKALSEQADARNTEILEKEEEIGTLKSEIAALTEEVAMYTGEDGKSSAAETLEQAATAYLNDSSSGEAMQLFAQIDPQVVENTQSASFKELYASLESRLKPQMRNYYYNRGVEALQSGSSDPAEAVKALETAYSYSNTGEDGYTSVIYYLAESYYQQYMRADTDEKENYVSSLAKAKQYFTEVVEEHPLSQHVESANDRLNAIQAFGVNLSGE